MHGSQSDRVERQNFDATPIASWRDLVVAAGHARVWAAGKFWLPRIRAQGSYLSKYQAVSAYILLAVMRRRMPRPGRFQQVGCSGQVDMRAAKQADHNVKLLQDLVPLNALSQERFGEIAEKIAIEVVKSGRILFRKGERDDRTIYLLEGTLEFIDENAKPVGVIAAGSEDSLHPIRNRQPRPVTARVKKKAVIAWIDSRLLDAYLTWDQFNTAEVVEHEADETGDWMSRLLKIDAFSSLPPAILQGLLMRMKPYPVQQGDEVISQGEEGEYFYTIHEGRCQVTRREDDGTHRVLAELGEGDSFGEEALVSEVQRNATITMLTDGQLMRLAKQDFNELLKKQRLRYVDYKTATKMVDEGAVWLDVRTPDEYGRGSFEDSVNLPLATLRSEIPELVFNTSYVICCDSRQCSDSAAFVLSHKGFDVYVLKG